MRSFVIGLFVALGASQAMASQYCSRYNGYPQYCSYTVGCYFDFNDGLCKDRPIGAPIPCRNLDMDPAFCNAQPGCYYDTFGQICAERFGGPGAPVICRNYDSDPAFCNSLPHCYFDTYGMICAERP